MPKTMEDAVTVLERQVRETFETRYSDYYAEELLLEREYGYIGTQALVTVCRRKISAATESGNADEALSFEKALPALEDKHLNARLALYGDGNGNYSR